MFNQPIVPTQGKEIDTYTGPVPPVIPTIETPTVDLKINNSDKPLIKQAPASINLSWDSTNANSCKASGAWSGNKALSGSEQITNISEGDYNYTLACNNQIANISDSVSLQVISYLPCDSDNDCSSICVGDPTCSTLCRTAPEISKLNIKVCWRTREDEEGYEPQCTSWANWGNCSSGFQTRWCTSGAAVYQIRTCQ